MSNTSTIKNLLSSIVPIDFTVGLANAVIKFCVAFETRRDHAIALNEPYLGLHKCQFLPSDQQAFFDIFSVNEKEITMKFSSKEIAGLMFHLTQTALRKKLIELDAIDAKRRVTSDVFNIFTVYAIHCAHGSKLPKSLKETVMITLAKLLQYRFFTSLVQHRFGYGADANIMRSVIDNLSLKFDITRYGSWKAVMENRANELVSSKSIHLDTIHKFDNDLAVLYLISDLQTRVRSQVQGVTNKYYAAKEAGDKLREYSVIGADLDGTKIILAQSNTFDTISTNLTNELMSVNQLIEPQLVSLICKMYSNIRADMFKTVLVRMSAMAMVQSKYSPVTDMKNSLDYTRKSKSGGTEYLGMRALLLAIIQKTYRYCVVNKVDVTSKLAILNTTKDIYSSSRITDPDIVDIRASTEILINKCAVSKRAATLASLRIAVVVYLMLKSFKFL